MILPVSLIFSKYSIGGAPVVTVIVIGRGIGYPNSIPEQSCISCSTNSLGKVMNIAIQAPAVDK